MYAMAIACCVQGSFLVLVFGFQSFGIHCQNICFKNNEKTKNVYFPYTCLILVLYLQV